MSGVSLKRVLDRTFRANPQYRCVRLSQLSQARPELLRDVGDDPDSFGVLLSKAEDESAARSVCQNTVRLLEDLAIPRQLPAYFRENAGEEPDRIVAEMVLDRILEVEYDGKFICGLEAHSLFFSDREPDPSGVLARLAIAALKYAQALQIDRVNELSLRLYLYNRIPLTPSWSHGLESEEAVADFLGVSGSANQSLLAKNWRQPESSEVAEPWFRWLNKRAGILDRSRGIVYKLYISPLPPALPRAFQTVVETLDSSSAHAFKIGSTAGGLLRPDKCVAYFSKLEALLETADEMNSALAGCPAQGVPFTSAIGETGLLSWGVDLPSGQGGTTSGAAESWRLWITNRLAAALVSARNNSGNAIEPWQFALDRLSLQNIDTGTWTPTEGYGLPA